MSTLDKKIARLQRQMRQRPHDKQAERAYYRLSNARTAWLGGLYKLWPDPAEGDRGPASLRRHSEGSLQRHVHQRDGLGVEVAVVRKPWKG
jgi:hypothetical protein